MDIEAIVRQHLDTPLITDNAKLFSALSQDSGLEQKANLTLLTSLTLFALSVVPVKPTSAQMLGFTLEAKHWVFLGLFLAGAVYYYASQLRRTWAIELRRQKYVVEPLRIKLYDALTKRVEEIQVELKAEAEKAVSNALATSLQADEMERQLAAVSSGYHEQDGELRAQQQVLRDENLSGRLAHAAYLERDSAIEAKRDELRTAKESQLDLIKKQFDASGGSRSIDTAALHLERSLLRTWMEDVDLSSHLSDKQKVWSSRIPSLGAGISIVVYAYFASREAYVWLSGLPLS